MQNSRIHRAAIFSAFAFVLVAAAGITSDTAKAGSEDTDFVCYDYFDEDNGKWETNCVTKEEFLLTCGENPNESGVEECQGTDLGKPSSHRPSGLASTTRIPLSERYRRVKPRLSLARRRARTRKAHVRVRARLANRYRRTRRHHPGHGAKIRSHRRVRRHGVAKGIGKLVGRVGRGIGSRRVRPHRRFSRRRAFRRTHLRRARHFGRIHRFRRFGGRGRRIR